MSERILIVDDQETVINSVKRGLPDYEWTSALDGEKALKCLSEQEFDLLITDVRMPGLDGIELLNRVDKMHGNGAINPYMAKVILTGYDDDEALDMSLKDRGTYRVEKPWGDELEVTIRRALEYSELSKASEARSKKPPSPQEHHIKMRNLGQSAAQAVHELNNPLTGILGYVEVVLAQLTDRELKEKLTLVRNEARRCQKIVLDILTYSRLHEVKKKVLDLNHILKDSVDGVLRELSGAEDIRVVSQYHKRDVPVSGDRFLLKSVFVNLIRNALQIMQESQEGNLLKIYTEEENGSLVISFEDNGPGISSENLEKIFTPFFSTRGKGGTGLGLSIVKEIIEAHGGTVEAKNVSSTGALFRLQLPSGD